MHDDDSFFSRLRRLQIDWGMQPAELARLLHVDTDRAEQWLKSGPGDFAGSVPPGGEAGASLISIHQHLSNKLSQAEKHVEWLTAPHPDMGGNRPLDIAAQSPEHVAWIAYFLASAPLPAERTAESPRA